MGYYDDDEVNRLVTNYKNAVNKVNELKESLAEANRNIDFIKRDRSTLIAEFDKMKEKFNDPTVFEGKYAKCMIAMYAILKSVSEEDSKTIIKNLLTELGEKYE